jgi:subtilisin family serine protease
MMSNGGNWGLDRIDVGGINNVFQYTATGKGIKVFVIGTGVLRTHDDFKDTSGNTRVSYVGDFCTGARRTSSSELDAGDYSRGHDTHVASFAAGMLSGVAKDARIYSLRTTWQSVDPGNANGWWACNDRSAVAAAINWLRADNNGHVYPDGIWRPAVVVYSGGSGTQAIRDAIDMAASMDDASVGYLFALSGNTGGPVSDHWGTSVPNKALVVGGTDRNDRQLNGNNDYGPLLGLYAPARGLTGASREGDHIYNILDPETACGCGGDSFAAPFVAGVAATYLELHPLASPATVRAAILSMASSIGLARPLLSSWPRA